jgi:small-conductance mechanosensitive channel
MPPQLAATTPNLQSCAGGPFEWLCTAIQTRTGSASVLGPLAQDVLDGIVVFLVILGLGWLLRRLAVGSVERHADSQVRTLTHNLMTFAMWLVAVVGGLVAGGFDPIWVFTFGGIFSLAIGLAFQDLLRNVLAGIFILAERPFRIGDRVLIADQSGVVQTIALRTTALRTADGNLALLPNLLVFQSVIVNSTAFEQRRFSLGLPVPPGTRPRALMEAARGALAATPMISTDPAPVVHAGTDAEGRRLVTVSYWLDHRTHDPDVVSGELLSRIWETSAEEPGGGAEATPQPAD